MGEPRKLICQCCGMPIDDDSILGRDKDGTLNEAYCKWCYADGTYTYNDMDEINEHVDNVCAFIKPGEVVLAWADDESDPQYTMSQEDLKVLEQETDAKGRKFRVHKMLIPKKPVCITEKELADDG